ncbi:MAG: uroporphyrinogen-III synthase [Alphaproteobacteria bacterium]
MGTQGGMRAAIDPSRLGMRALVTRPRVEAATLAEALAERGVAALLEPLLDIHYRDPGHKPDLAGVQAVLCTSANGVRAFARLSRERAVPIFAVGDATAAQARAAGFPEVHSADGAVGDLVALVGGRLRPEAGRLLHIAGSVVAGDLSGELRARGFSVDRAVLYEAQPVGTLSAATMRALAAGIVDFALFFSPRTAAIFTRLVDQAGIAAAMRHVTAISISAAADAALDPLRFRARRVAGRPNQPALLAALDRLVEERRLA